MILDDRHDTAFASVMSIIPLTSVVCAILAIVFLWLRYWRTARKLPPGPMGYPLIGNVFDMMVSEMWVVAQKWGRIYGVLLSKCHACGLINLSYS